MFIQIYISISPEHGHTCPWLIQLLLQSDSRWVAMASSHWQSVVVIDICGKSSIWCLPVIPYILNHCIHRSPEGRGNGKLTFPSFVSEIPLFVRRHLMERNAREFCRCGESSDESWARKWRRWFINEENDRWSSVHDLSIIWWRIKQ